MTQELQITLDGREIVVDRADYVRRKTAQLREFGYTTVTAEYVDEQITALLEGKKFGAGLTAVGMMMDKEVRLPQPMKGEG